MLDALSRLARGLLAIAAAAAFLLWTDWSNRRQPESPMPRVAILQHASQKVIDEGVAGMLAGLAERGYVDGDSIDLRRFNAEGDIATANALAQELASGDYDVVLTATTVSLQTFANANRAGKVKHVFALVTDPSKAGVNIGADPLDHPAHMVGLGTLQPVRESLELAKKLFPGLKTVGCVWNPAEINSQICTEMARAACADMGLTLKETNAENSASVRESASAVIGQRVDLLWVGGDVTVLTALDTVVDLARKAKIPVVTCIPGSAAKGALFDVGANYTEVGRAAGSLGADALAGVDLATLPVKLFVPKTLHLNLTALTGLRDPWRVSDDVRAQADLLIDADGAHVKGGSAAAGAVAPSPSGRRPKRIHMLEYVNVPDSKDAERGVFDGLAEAGLKEGVDYTVKLTSAAGDMATLGAMVEAALSEQSDLMVVVSTPTLQAAARRGKPTTPVVFTFVADPVAAGVAKSDTDHMHNVTGAYGAGDVDGMIALVKEIMPKAKRLGMIHVPNETNCVFNYRKLRAAADAAGYETVPLGVNTSVEVADAAVALTTKGVDLIVLPASNLTSASFPSIIQPAKRAKIPVFGFMGMLADQGATVALAREFHEMGRLAGVLAAKVLRGSKPADLPLAAVTKNELVLNLTAAKSCGVTFPAAVRARAGRVIDK